MLIIELFRHHEVKNLKKIKFLRHEMQSQSKQQPLRGCYLREIRRKVI